MTSKVVAPARGIRGDARVPGDKSISHRYAILAGLAEGQSELCNFSSAGDCARTLECLLRLGISVRTEGDRVRITGKGLSGLEPPSEMLDAGNSGTTMRLLAGVLAGQKFPATLTGDDSLRRRPMRRVIEPLERMGARIVARDGEFAPLEIRGGRLQPIEYPLPVPSAQVKSAVLLAGLFAEGVTAVVEPVRTRDHLEVALGEFGAEVERSGETIRVQGRPRLRGRQLTVPGDLSAAVFYLAAALVVPGSELVVHSVGVNPTRTAVLDFLASMGAPISLLGVSSRQGEFTGDIAIRHAPLSGGVISGVSTVQMIDELPMLAALGAYTERGIEIHDAAELRVKESDRISVVAGNLRRMGAQVETFPDGLRVEGRSAGALRGAEIDSAGDHRIAMAFSIAALGARGETVISDTDCVGVSFPEFFFRLESLAER